MKKTRKSRKIKKKRIVSINIKLLFIYRNEEWKERMDNVTDLKSPERRFNENNDIWERNETMT